MPSLRCYAYPEMMKSFVALMILLVLASLARAEGPDDQYIAIYNQIQLGDALAEKGDSARALDTYTEAENNLKKFQADNPQWYGKVVKYRLNYLASKIAQISPKIATPAPSAPPISKPAPVQTNAGASGATAFSPKAAPAAPATVTPLSPNVATATAASTAAEGQIKALQEQIRNVEADKANLEAKLKEALAAQPAAVDPRELAKAQAVIKDLQKENELLKISLTEAKTNAIQSSPAAAEQARKALEEANRKVAQLTEANATLAMEKDALQARFKTLAPPPDAATAALREENEILKKELASIKSREAAAPPGGDMQVKLQEAQSQLAVLQSEQQIWRLEKIALENQLRQRSSIPAISANTKPAAAALPASDNNSAEIIRQLETQRDELQKSLATAAKLTSGRRESKEMAAHIAEMTREMAGLRARIDILEARPIPYTADELALITKPDATTLVAASVHHSATAKSNREVSSKVAVLLAEAKQYWVARNLEKAEQKYVEVLHLDSKDATFLADLASIQSDRGHMADAEKNLKAALVINPNDDYSLFILGILKLRQEKYDESLDAFSRAAQANPQNAKIQNYIGIALSEKGVRGPAEAAFRKAIQIDPGYADAHANLAFVYLTQKPPLVELARWHYKKALDAGHAHDPSLEKLLGSTKAASNP